MLKVLSSREGLSLGKQDIYHKLKVLYPINFPLSIMSKLRIYVYMCSMCFSYS